MEFKFFMLNKNSNIYFRYGKVKLNVRFLFLIIEVIIFF